VLVGTSNYERRNTRALCQANRRYEIQVFVNPTKVDVRSRRTKQAN
jgi:hypothetical protein